MQLKINGKKVFFSSLGSGKQILILPGWGNDHYVWQNIQNLLSKDFQVTVIDFPGFGDSQINPRLKNLDEYAKFLKKIMEELNLLEVILIGHSFGGSVALKASIHYPNMTISKLILVDSSGLRHFHPKKLLGLLLAKPGKMIFSLPILKRWHQDMKSFLYHRLGEIDYLKSGPLKEVFKRIVAENLEGQLDRLKKPTFIVWGKKDNITPKSLADIFQRKIAGSKLFFLDNCGHFPFLEDPIEFCKIIREIAQK